MAGSTEFRWCKSSNSAEQAEYVEIVPLMGGWRKSRHSADQAECVEVAPFSGARGASQRMIAVRDSKNPNGPWLSFTESQWSIFTNSIKMRSLRYIRSK